MRSCLIILTGASGSGKTTLLNDLLDCNSVFAKAPKYSTRKWRGEGDDIVDDDTEISIESFDLVYNLNNERYGLRYNEIDELLSKKKVAVIILSNIRIIKTLKERYKDKVLSLYLSSSIDQSELLRVQYNRYKEKFSLTETEIEKLERQFRKLKGAITIGSWDDLFRLMNELNVDWKRVLPMYQSTELRATKIRDFHKTYLDNIHIFDHVILNYNVYIDGKIGRDMTKQVLNILNSKSDTRKKGNRIGAKLFVLIAASGAGKGELMQTIRLSMKESIIRILSKQAKRSQKPNDKRDGLIAIGKDGLFKEEYDIKWTFHKSDSFKGIEYAVNSSEIEKNFRDNVHQIVVSNFGQVNMFKKRFGKDVSFIYLHALRNSEDVKKYQYENNNSVEEAETRINEIQNVYNGFVEQNEIFDHVFLNTTFLEDLYEQSFNLFEHYKF